MQRQPLPVTLWPHFGQKNLVSSRRGPAATFSLLVLSCIADITLGTLGAVAGGEGAAFGFGVVEVIAEGKVEDV